jgi:hypothetical protein
MAGASLLAIVASIAGGIAGIVLVRELEASLGRSLDITVDALAAVDDSLTVAADTLALVDDALVDTERASRQTVTALGTGADLLRSTADLTEDELAPSIGAVERSLPNVVAVAGAADSALSALSRLPIGISYDPRQGLDDSLRELQTSLSGTSEELVQQSTLVREAGDQLDVVGAGAAAIADDLARLDSAVTEARALMDDYSATADDTRRLIAATRDDLDERSTVAIVMVAAMALAVTCGQLAPLWIGRQIIRHAERLDALFDRAS